MGKFIFGNFSTRFLDEYVHGDGIHIDESGEWLGILALSEARLFLEKIDKISSYFAKLTEDPLPAENV